MHGHGSPGGTSFAEVNHFFPLMSVEQTELCLWSFLLWTWQNIISWNKFRKTPTFTYWNTQHLPWFLFFYLKRKIPSHLTEHLRSFEFIVTDLSIFPCSCSPVCPSCLPSTLCIGPFEIEKIINPSAIRPKLPDSLKIHPMFHISLLKPVSSSPLVLVLLLVPPVSPPLCVCVYVPDSSWARLHSPMIISLAPI